MNFPIARMERMPDHLCTWRICRSITRYPAVYHRGWAESNILQKWQNVLWISNCPWVLIIGGPLFFSHYSFLGLDPRGLKDRYADYWEQNKNHTLINHKHCVANPKNFKGYGENCWGLTASDTYDGYNAHSPDR